MTLQPQTQQAADEARSILRWVLATLGDRAVVVSSLGPQTLVVLELVAELGGQLPVLTIDTGFLFEETVALRARVEARYGLQIRVVRPPLSPSAQTETHGRALWERDPDRCCALRKVNPLRSALGDYDAWITGLRRDQGATRTSVAPVQWDSAYGIAKFNPLASWTRAEVAAFTTDRGIPLNPLLTRGYRSVGCTHCTRPTGADDERAGRWPDSDKTECGIHQLFPRSST